MFVSARVPLVVFCLCLSFATSCGRADKSGAHIRSALPPEAKKAGWSRLVPDLSFQDAEKAVGGLQVLGTRDFLERAYGLILARDPETAYAYGFSAMYGIPEDGLSDLSDAHALGTRNLYLSLGIETGRRLAGVADDESRLALAALSRWVQDKATDIEYSFDHYLVCPYVNSADQLALAYFTESRRLANTADAERWIACLSSLPGKMKGLADALDLRAAAGVVPPRGILEATIRQVAEVAEATPEGTPLYGAFARRIAGAQIGSEAQRTALLSKAAASIGEYAVPAWKLVAGALERQRAKAPARAGASSLPDGEAFYASCLSRLTTTGLGAKAIHELGLQELARVQAEMRARFESLGYPVNAGFAALYSRLGAEAPVRAGEELLGRVSRTMAAMDERLGELVLVRPRLRVEAVFGEMGGYYQSPSSDGARPGRYFVARGDQRYAYDIDTTVYHETLPGHHLQIARAIEADIPGFLRGADFLGFTEGWALYSERLASELGAYASDPAGELGRLRMEALRAARLVADTGVNAMGWSFDKAAAFLAENTGQSPGMIQSDVTRYFVDPGQATAYYVGFLELLRLREKCRAELGAGFDLRRFHEAILSHGNLPLDLLSAVVDRHIESEKARLGGGS